MSKLLNLLTLLLVAQGCITGPKDKSLTPIEQFSGEHYETSNQKPMVIDRIPVPIAKRRRASSITKGRVITLKNGLPTPLSQQPVEIIQQGKVVAGARTEPDGTFHFALDLPDGTYEAVLNTDHFNGRTSFEIRNQVAKEFELVVTETAVLKNREP